MTGIKENPEYSYFPSFKTLKQMWKLLNIGYAKNKTEEKNLQLLSRTREPQAYATSLRT